MFSGVPVGAICRINYCQKKRKSLLLKWMIILITPALSVMISDKILVSFLPSLAMAVR